VTWQTALDNLDGDCVFAPTKWAVGATPLLAKRPRFLSRPSFGQLLSIAAWHDPTGRSELALLGFLSGLPTHLGISSGLARPGTQPPLSLTRMLGLTGLLRQHSCRRSWTPVYPRQPAGRPSTSPTRFTISRLSTRGTHDSKPLALCVVPWTWPAQRFGGTRFLTTSAGSSNAY